jgi:hypothetical protein
VTHVEPVVEGAGLYRFTLEELPDRLPTVPCRRSLEPLKLLVVGRGKGRHHPVRVAVLPAGHVVKNHFRVTVIEPFEHQVQKGGADDHDAPHDELEWCALTRRVLELGDERGWQYRFPVVTLLERFHHHAQRFLRGGLHTDESLHVPRDVESAVLQRAATASSISSLFAAITVLSFAAISLRETSPSVPIGHFRRLSSDRARSPEQ